MSYGRRQADDWENENRDWLAAKSGQVPEPEETVVGQDPAGVVAVTATFDAQVVSVALAEGWKSLVDARQLHAHVLAAANAASMLALEKQLESTDIAGANQPQATPDPDTSPLTRQDVDRLLEAVDNDLKSFMQQVTSTAEQVVTAESPGRNVSGTAKQGQVLQVSLDPGWASSARNAEIESELTAVLVTLHSKSTPTALAAGPRSRAIDELNSLAADPQALLRRLGLGS